MPEPTPEQKRKLATPVRTFVFIRKDGFYPLSIPEGTVEDNAKCNPGTIRVEDVFGNVIWKEDGEG